MLMRLVAQFTKEERIKYISHLDVVRVFQRALCRSNIPVAYSQGFNPHPRLSFASALSVGMTSDGEYLDIILNDYINPIDFCNIMNDVLPLGIRVKGAIEIDNRAPSLTSVITRAEYCVKIVKPNICFENYIAQFLSQNEILVTKRSKKRDKVIDIRDMIYELKVSASDTNTLFMTLEAGNIGSLNPELLMNTFFKSMNIIDSENAMYNVHRLNMFFYQNNRWLTPLELGKGEQQNEQANNC